MADKAAQPKEAESTVEEVTSVTEKPTKPVIDEESSKSSENGDSTTENGENNKENGRNDVEEVDGAGDEEEDDDDDVVEQEEESENLECKIVKGDKRKSQSGDPTSDVVAPVEGATPEKKAKLDEESSEANGKVEVSA